MRSFFFFVTPSQHLKENIIRQKLIVAIAKCQRARQKYEEERKAVQSLRTGALVSLFEKILD